MEGAETCWGDRASLPVYDPVGDFFRTGITAINSLIFTAGNSHVQNYFSYANTTARGIVPKNNLSKHNFNLRESSSFFDDLGGAGKLDTPNNQRKTYGRGILYEPVTRFIHVS